MKIIYLSHPSSIKERGAELTVKLRQLGWVVLNPFEQRMNENEIFDRDLEMIDKSDYVLVYWPEKIFSVGTPIELYYASSHKELLHIFILVNDESILFYPFINSLTLKGNQFTNTDKLFARLRSIS